MNIKPPLESANEIERITRNLLLASKAWGKLPTPVDSIAQFAQLQIETGVDLANVEPDFFTKHFYFAKKALSKVIGLIDFRQKKIYLDHTQSPSRKNFVKLHEVGHEALSWQSTMKGFMDDDQTLDPLVDELFEREASYFASASLFQLERFEDELAKLPLSIKSAQVLGQKFGGSSILRRTNLVVNGQSPAMISTLYSYDAASRLSTVSDGTNTAVYTYLANSPLIGQIGFNNNGTLRMTTTKQYDYLNRVADLSGGPAIGTFVTATIDLESSGTASTSYLTPLLFQKSVTISTYFQFYPDRELKDTWAY